MHTAYCVCKHCSIEFTRAVVDNAHLISTQVMDKFNLYGCFADNLVFSVKVASSGSPTGMLLCTTLMEK